MEAGVMKVEDCNNHVKSAAAFFKSGCAVNILSDKHNPLGETFSNIAIKILILI